jgi:hypothetical protein
MRREIPLAKFEGTGVGSGFSVESESNGLIEFHSNRLISDKHYFVS